MKFVTLRIPLVFVDSDDVASVATHADVRMLVHDGCTVNEAVSRFSDRLGEALKLVDLGDEE